MAAELQQVEDTAIMKVSGESVTIYDRVIKLKVVDQQSYNAMVALHEASKAVIKAAKEVHDPLCNHLYEMHRKATAARAADLGRAEDAKRLAKQKAAAWQDKQERIRIEAQRKAEEEARRIAEEQARIAREKAEAEAAELRKREEAERLRLAEDAERSGASQERVDEILETPLYVPEVKPEPIAAPVVMPTIAPTFQKAQGFTVRTSYSAEVKDMGALIRAAAANPALAIYLMPNDKMLNQTARNQKQAFSVPGCVLREDRV